MFESEVEAPSYSVVVPFHNEEESVRELHQRLSEAMTNRFEPVEFIFIDDHSTDRTMAALKEIASLDPRVVVIRLKRNFGQTVALAAGFDYAEGDVIISMDGDLQHDPADIPQMLAVFQETGCDIASGWRKKRVDNFLLRRINVLEFDRPQGGDVVEHHGRAALRLSCQELLAQRIVRAL